MGGQAEERGHERSSGKGMEGLEPSVQAGDGKDESREGSWRRGLQTQVWEGTGLVQEEGNLTSGWLCRWGGQALSPLAPGSLHLPH